MSRFQRGRQWPPITLLILFLVCIWSGDGQGACPSKVGNSTTQKLITRPETEKLSRLIRNGPSFIPKKYRLEAAALIENLDQSILLLIQKAGLAVRPPINITDWIRGKTCTWPALTPNSERGFFCGLALQVEMLDLLLREKDNEMAEYLRRSRNKIRIRKANEIHFGDSRDMILSSVFTKIDQICDIQIAMGARRKIIREKRWSHMSFEDIIAHILNDVRVLANNVGQISKF